VQLEAAPSPPLTQSKPGSADRFEFGANWRAFLSLLDEDRIVETQNYLRDMLEVADLEGRTFLDVGSGSGLSSLAARRLGARVHSFDYDPLSVACTTELRRRYFPDDPDWRVEQGSVLDHDFLGRLGRFDVVHSWGVLHHTGDMWSALGEVADLVAPDRGRLFIAIYNDQGRTSRVWKAVKRAYCRAPKPLRPAFAAASVVPLWGPRLLLDALKLQPLRSWRAHGRRRGMSAWYDVVDWVGGYPFEVAKPEELFDFYRRRGFTLRRLVTRGGGLGNNELVFERSARTGA
jgi:2-polyprenyl-3-methyl-5-hydroxy-6-metoxy-1,4-benzoquinol methylase